MASACCMYKHAQRDSLHIKRTLPSTLTGNQTNKTDTHTRYQHANLFRLFIKWIFNVITHLSILWRTSFMRLWKFINFKKWIHLSSLLEIRRIKVCYLVMKKDEMRNKGILIEISFRWQLYFKPGAQGIIGYI